MSAFLTGCQTRSLWVQRPAQYKGTKYAPNHPLQKVTLLRHWWAKKPLTSRLKLSRMKRAPVPLVTRGHAIGQVAALAPAVVGAGICLEQVVQRLQNLRYAGRPGIVRNDGKLSES